MRHIPNIITALRLVLALAFPFVDNSLWVFVLSLSLATEFLDGFIARIFGWQSNLGQLLDPIADKAFILSVVLVFLSHGLINAWHLGLILFRDFTVGATLAWAYFSARWFRQISFDWSMAKPRLLGKVATTFQFVFLLVLVLHPSWTEVLFKFTATISIASGLDYFYYYLRTTMRRVD